jgi:hypothetical protein
VRGTFLVLALVVAPPAHVRAQDAPIDREQLTRFARAHMAMGAARDEFHAKLGRIHDDAGLVRARQELDARIAQILNENALSPERYGIITLVISQNEEVRTVFEEISRQLGGGGGTVDTRPTLVKTAAYRRPPPRGGGACSCNLGSSRWVDSSPFPQSLAWAFSPTSFSRPRRSRPACASSPRTRSFLAQE